MRQSVHEQLEQYIVIGMIVSDEYMHSVRRMYNPRYLKSPTAKLLATWCIEYFDKYEKAPYMDIEPIFYQKMKDGLSKDLAEEIEEDILPQLSQKYDTQDHFNHQYWIDQTKKYFREQNLKIHADGIKILTEEGKLDEAESKAKEFEMSNVQLQTGLNLNSEETFIKIYQAFEESKSPLVQYPWALGRFWNEQLIRGAFVALLAPEKRGKTFMLLDMAIRGVRAGNNVAFFQAGDMTELQQLLRMCIYFSKMPRKEKYCGPRLKTVADCYYNQIDTCKRKDRFCNFGVLPDVDEEQTREEIQKDLTYNRLKELREDFPTYVPCTNNACGRWEEMGALWLVEDFVKGPLVPEIAIQNIKAFVKQNKATLKMSTHAGDLTKDKMQGLLYNWFLDEGFVPDIILVDYADLVKPKRESEFRHRQNEVWEGFRQLTFEQHCLLVTATQADAKSYDKDSLKLSNFSEDKRKYAHVTAFYGLNQDTKGREKKLGILRLNELLLREDDFEVAKEVKVIQDLSRGRPVLKSFF